MRSMVCAIKNLGDTAHASSRFELTRKNTKRKWLRWMLARLSVSATMLIRLWNVSIWVGENNRTEIRVARAKLAPQSIFQLLHPRDGGATKKVHRQTSQQHQARCCHRVNYMHPRNHAQPTVDSGDSSNESFVACQ